MPAPSFVLPRLALLAVLTSGLSAAAEEAVRLVVEKDGITVHERPVEGRTLPILIGRTTMQAEPATIVAWILAAHTHTEWMQDCSEAREIRRDGNQIYGYNRVSLPWPVADRDSVFRSTITERAGGEIGLAFEGVELPEVPEVDGVVRVPQVSGHWVFQPGPEGTVVEYTVDTDPGGRLPHWLVRNLSREAPVQTLTRLRERAESGLPPDP